MTKEEISNSKVISIRTGAQDYNNFGNPVIDDLTKEIKGIGPCYSGILAQAWINNLERLAKADPEKIKSEIRRHRSGNAQNFPLPMVESWIAQARAATQKAA